MNNYIPDWNFAGDLPAPGLRNPAGADHDLAELLWRNGQVVMQSQTLRKQAVNVNAPMEPQRQACSKLTSPVNDMAHDDETVSWVHFPIEDPFDREFCSNFFSELPSSDPVDAPPPPLRGVPEADQMPPPRPARAAAAARGEAASHCGSNQVDGTNGGAASGPPRCSGGGASRGKSGRSEPMHDPTVTSSSGGSGSSFGRAGRQFRGGSRHKRKAREAEELESDSDVAELESAPAKKSGQRSGSSRKSRAAEVHNMSERRRRDRINEKMKALQELIPHSNKTDKASMLDEAIDYLKSLQLQLQVMWMGSGMAPVMFPGLQHYMSRMSMAATHMPMQGPRADQMVGHAPESLMMPSASFPEQYARFMGFHPMQMQAHLSQPVNMVRYSPQRVQQQGQSSMIHSSGGASVGGGASSAKIG